MSEMSPETRAILHQVIADANLADMRGLDVGPLTRLDEMTEDEAVEALDQVYRKILCDE